MHFLTLATTALLATFASAKLESVTVQNLTILENNGTITGASLHLEPKGVNCTANGTALANFSVAKCGKSKYRFAVNGTLDYYELRLYHETGLASGRYGEYDGVPTYCHAGVNVTSFICSSVTDFNVTLA